MRVHVFLIAALLLGSWPRPAEAQAAERLSHFNLPYLHYYGFGVFEVGDHRVGVLRLLGAPELRSHEDHSVGLGLRLSGSFARLKGTAEGESDQGILSLVPGLEWRWATGSRSLLRVVQDLGVTVQLDTGRKAVLTQSAATVELVWPAGRFEVGFAPTAAFAAALSSDDRLRDEMVGLLARVDVRHPLWFELWENGAEGGVYAEVSRFWVDSERSGVDDGLLDIGSQVEVGLTFGTNPATRILFFRPLLNVGVRFGDDFRGLRLSFSDRLVRLPARDWPGASPKR